MGDEKYPSLAVIIPSYFVPQQLSKALFGSVGWVGRYPGDVANSTSLERDGMTILHGAQPTIFRANSSLLRTNGTAAAREMVGWVSHKLEGHGRKQALNQPQTPGFHPTLRSPQVRATVGWNSYQSDTRGRRRATKRPSTHGLQPTHPTIPTSLGQ